ARVAEHIDLQSLQKGTRQLVAPLAELLKLRMMFESQDLDDMGGERATLQQSLEGLQLNLRELAVFSDDLIELQHPGLFAVHSKQCGGRVRGTRQDAPPEPRDHGSQKDREDSPAMADDRAPVGQRGRLRTVPFLANVG